MSIRAFTAMTKASALPRPAIPRNTSHTGTAVVSGIATRLSVTAASAARHTAPERASFGRAAAASAPTRYPM